MDKDYSELIEHLDGKFSDINGEFLTIKKSLVNIEGRLTSIDEKKADKSDTNNLMSAVDSYAKRADTYF